MKEITELNHNEVRDFFLKEESYLNFDLPPYFEFGNLIQTVSDHLTGHELSSFFSVYNNEKGKQKNHLPANFENVNYKFLTNKNGKYAWRPFQLIHPVLYVSLVHKITEKANWDFIIGRFSQFQSNSKIRCYSIPLHSATDDSYKAISISRWWKAIEQQSIVLALKYDYVLHTDIIDCYGSLYTHSVPWAIHSKELAKEQRNEKSLIGNIIDKHLQYMSYGQTNGIPQGSVLMDFIAEIVLGYTDLKLSEKIQRENIQDYEIIRYRDDYRIFSNNPQTAEKIAKILTEILVELGLRLNAQKTLISNNVVKDSIKSDKLYWISAKKGTKNIQEHLLLIHKLSEQYPNSGSLTKALNKFHDRIKGLTKTIQNLKVLISILVDIMYKNPKIYPIASAILSKLLFLMSDDKQKNEMLSLINQKFEKLPNTGHLKIWLQRITIKLNKLKNYDEDLCKKVNDINIQLWNSDWIEPNLKTLIETTPIINETIINDIDEVISSEEVQLFKSDYDAADENEE